MAWSNWVQVQVVRITDFSIEMQVRLMDGNEEFWAIFVYASTNSSKRMGQWEKLKEMKTFWGEQ